MGRFVHVDESVKCKGDKCLYISAWMCMWRPKEEVTYPLLTCQLINF